MWTLTLLSHPQSEWHTESQSKRTSRLQAPGARPLADADRGRRQEWWCHTAGCPFAIQVLLISVFYSHVQLDYQFPVSAQEAQILKHEEELCLTSLSSGSRQALEAKTMAWFRAPMSQNCRYILTMALICFLDKHQWGSKATSGFFTDSSILLINRKC